MFLGLGGMRVVRMKTVDDYRVKLLMTIECKENLMGSEIFFVQTAWTSP